MNPSDQEKDHPLTEPEHYELLASIARRELWRFDLTKQHLRIASVLIELSYGLGRTSVRIDRLRVFCDLTGMDKGNISRTLEDLSRMRIITSRRVSEKDLMEYEVEPDSDKWRCQPLQLGEKLLETLRWVQMLNEPALPSQAKPTEPQSPPDMPADWND